jgi:uncharacterized repeat protein (TIGR03803 family)
MSAAQLAEAFIVLLFGLTLAFTGDPAHAQTETVLYSFTNGSDGAEPLSNLTSDGKGNFYGTASEGGLGANGYGTVFELSPNGSKGWSESTVYAFCSLANCTDGAFPYSDVIFDSAGNLYGTAFSGGANDNGVVFELSPTGKKWKEKVLYSFASGSNEGGPQTGLIMDSSGDLYGTDAAGVFELTPSGKKWTEEMIYQPASYAGLVTGLTMDASGNIYGLGYSSAFELSPNGKGGWNPTVLYNFLSPNGLGPNPVGGPVLDKAGNLYGATYHGGTHHSDGKIFELVHKKTKWTEKVLYDFGGAAGDGANPNAGVVLDSNGNIYGTTLYGGSSNYGTVFELVAPVGTGAYEEKILTSFDGTDGRAPYASLIFDSSGNLYGTTLGGGSSNEGTVFEVAP